MLAGFLTRSRFAWLAAGTREAYAEAYISMGLDHPDTDPGVSLTSFSKQ